MCPLKLRVKKQDAINLSRKQVRKWFRNNDGKLCSPIEKLLDTPEHRRQQKELVLEYDGLFTNPFSPICYINKKWFYNVNWRRALKILPGRRVESDNVELARKSKMLSCQFPI